MGVNYFKRYRMEIPLRGFASERCPLPFGYRLVPWHPSLLELHAEAKCRSFCGEIDAAVFPCLGDLDGCRRLMTEIADKRGFLPQATWLLLFCGVPDGRREACGTVQGICDSSGGGSIQNLGVTPEHRGQGLGTHLLWSALEGFARTGLMHASLEVTAQNVDAVRLYRRMGFRRIKTVYKAVEVAYS